MCTVLLPPGVNLISGDNDDDDNDDDDNDDDYNYNNVLYIDTLCIENNNRFSITENDYEPHIARPSGRAVLRRQSAAARLLKLLVRTPPGAWMFICCELCVLSGRGLCDGPITRQDESYRKCYVVVCGLGTLQLRTLCPTNRLSPPKTKTTEPYTR
jgi:hypothetical protein